jgi:hypothetical protein
MKLHRRRLLQGTLGGAILERQLADLERERQGGP